MVGQVVRMFMCSFVFVKKLITTSELCKIVVCGIIWFLRDFFRPNLVIYVFVWSYPALSGPMYGHIRPCPTYPDIYLYFFTSVFLEKARRVNGSLILPTFSEPSSSSSRAAPASRQARSDPASLQISDEACDRAEK